MKRAAILLLAVLFLLAGCQSDSASTSLEEGEVTVYYTNVSSTRLVSDVYTLESTETDEQIRELYEQMQVGDGEEYVASVPSELLLGTFSLNGTILSMDLEGEYYELSSAKRILCLAALTRTLTQVDGVEGLSVSVNGEAVTDSEGNSMGILRSTTFVDNAVDNPDDYKEETVVLYFANAEGDKLVETTTTVVYRSSTALERVVVEELLQGPDDSSLTATLPSTATLLGINVRDGICYVNFDENFITDIVGSYDYIPVYSLVNSLTELSTVDKVQISINGSTETAFTRDITSFAMPFERNMEYVEGD